MAYDKEKLYIQAKEIIENNKHVYFIEDLVSLLPCDKTTFYRLFDIESNEYDAIKTLLDQNRIDLKIRLRSKWSDSENATLQITLMKLICTDDERKKMSVNYTENEVSFNKTPLVIDWTPDNGKKED